MTKEDTKNRGDDEEGEEQEIKRRQKKSYVNLSKDPDIKETEGE